jgi:hypothetical protein
MSRISQATLAAVIKQRIKVEQAQAKLNDAEGRLTAALKSGSEVQQGLFTARIKEFERRKVGWKAIVVREKGEDYAQRVLAATKPDKYESLEVELAS